MRLWLITILCIILAGCSSHRAPAPNARLSDSITVIAYLNEQLQSWHGTPYAYGGMSRRGIDCSGFVLTTYRDKFALQLPRMTSQQAEIGTRIDKTDLLPGDLVFSLLAQVKMVCMSESMTRITNLFMPLPVGE